MRFQPLVAYYHLIQQRIEVSLGFIRHHTRTGSEFQSPFMDKLPDLAALGRILSEILFHEQAKVKNCKLTRSRGPTKVIKFHQSSQISPQSHQITSKLSSFTKVIKFHLPQLPGPRISLNSLLPPFGEEIHITFQKFRLDHKRATVSGRCSSISK